MAERQIEFDALVQLYDPDYDTEEQPEYVFGNRVVKTRPQEQPGVDYSWLRDS